ncbi:MAG TPA: DUF308 domain-containing protein [Micromonosporaceae bacterium]
MTAGGARRGRRDNGLDAAEYAVAADVDPRVGEHLLDVLASAGIAAYLQPSADLNPVTRTTTVPARPTDRLYVDRAHLGTAQDFLARLAEEEPAGTSERADPDLDAQWNHIVASFYADTTATRSWPAAEDLPDRASGGDPEGATPARPGTDSGQPTTGRTLPSVADISGISVNRRPDEPSLLDGLDTFGADLPDGPEEGYTPPPPPPLPRISGYAVAAVLAILVGCLLLVSPDVLPIDHGMTVFLGFVGIIGGFVTLVWRLRPGDDEDYDPDDGAVV